jgi:hypothetical protein
VSTRIRIIQDEPDTDSTINIFRERASSEGLEVYQIEPLVNLLSKSEMSRASMAKDFIGFLEKCGAIDGEAIDIRSKTTAVRVAGQSFHGGLITK